MKKLFLSLLLSFVIFPLCAQNQNEGRNAEAHPAVILQDYTENENSIFVSDQDEFSQMRDSCFYDDVLVTGSLGVGFDVTDGMTFGYSTVILKENNVSILFEDSSVETGSFPSNDWSLNANSTDSGGDNYFEIKDVTGDNVPFKIMAGAANHSIFVDEMGRVGLKNQDPMTELHLSDGNTPTLRLDQDASGGWGVQTWDLAGNEANFFVRDVNASTLPFRIKPGAPSSSLYIDSNGDICIGGTEPSVKLDVKGHMAVDSTLILTPQTIVPDTAHEGSLLMDNNVHMLKYFNGTEWKTISENSDEQDLVSATLSGTILDIEIENGAAVSVDLQPLIADLESRITALEESVLGKSTSEFNGARIFQNTPNPYSENTTIPFFIPQNVSNARMIVADVNGILIEQIVIYARGEGSLEFNQSDLENGTYFYTLVLDGKQLESKVMVKVN